MEASDSIKGSYAWRSILHGREILRKGAQWRVGNGKDISIWGKAGLPSVSIPRVNNPMGIDFPEIKISLLINSHTRNWDMDLLQALFRLEEVKLIRSIPLGNVSTRDKIVWSHSQSSVYSVKSGYYFFSKDRYMLNDGSVSSKQSQKLWKLIWSLSVPAKVRNFMWRTTKNAIPVKTNLVKRKVLLEASCDHCHLHPEIVMHALWSCQCLTEVWESDQAWNFKCVRSFTDFQQLILYIAEAGLDLDMFSMVVWTLWHRRNQLRIGSSILPLGQIISQAQQTLLDFYRVQPMQTTPSSSISRPAAL